MNAQDIVKSMKKVKPFSLKFEGKGRLKSDKVNRTVKFFEVTVNTGVMTITGKAGELVIDGIAGDDFAGRIEAQSFEIFAYLDGDVTLGAFDGALTGWVTRNKFTLMPVEPSTYIRWIVIANPHINTVTFEGATYVTKFTQGYRNFEIVAL